MTLERTIEEIRMIARADSETVKSWWHCDTKKEAIELLLERKNSDLWDSTILKMAGIDIDNLSN